MVKHVLNLQPDGTAIESGQREMSSLLGMGMAFEKYKDVRALV
jgi:hypothetical protein